MYYYGPEEKRGAANNAIQQVLAKESWVDILRVYYYEGDSPGFQVVISGTDSREDDRWIPKDF